MIQKNIGNSIKQSKDNDSLDSVEPAEWQDYFADLNATSDLHIINNFVS